MTINLDALVEALDEVIYEEVAAEQCHQEVRFGYQLEHDSGKWLAILTEEVGEVAQSLLTQKPTDAQDTYKELIQVASVALSWARAIEVNKVLQEDNAQAPEQTN